MIIQFYFFLHRKETFKTLKVWRKLSISPYSLPPELENRDTEKFGAIFVDFESSSDKNLSYYCKNYSLPPWITVMVVSIEIFGKIIIRNNHSENDQSSLTWKQLNCSKIETKF